MNWINQTGLENKNWKKEADIKDRSDRVESWSQNMILKKSLLQIIWEENWFVTSINHIFRVMQTSNINETCSSQRKTKGTRRSCYTVVLGFKREIRHRHAHTHINMTYLICRNYRILFLEPCWSCWCWWCTRRECGASPLKPVNAIEATKGGIQRDSMIQNYGQGHSGSMRSLWMPPLVAVET